MGNYQSQSEIDNLKKLYSLSKAQLIALESRLKKEKMFDDTLVKTLIKKQKSLIGRVPPEQYNNVSTFLVSMLNRNIQMSINRGAASSQSVNREAPSSQSFKKKEDEFKQQFINEQKERERIFY